MDIRLATIDDLPAILDIYNEQVLNGVATFDTEPYNTPERRIAWWKKHPMDRYPVIVAVEGSEVIGWASLSAWSDRCAYARAAEASVYVRKDQRGRGVGLALMPELIAQARRIGVCVLLARIALPAPASLRLHESAGFKRIGTMRRVGEKFGRIIDVEMLDIHLDDGGG